MFVLFSTNQQRTSPFLWIQQPEETNSLTPDDSSVLGCWRCSQRGSSPVHRPYYPSPPPKKKACDCSHIASLSLYFLLTRILFFLAALFDVYESLCFGSRCYCGWRSHPSIQLHTFYLPFYSFRLPFFFFFDPTFGTIEFIRILSSHLGLYYTALDNCNTRYHHRSFLSSPPFAIRTGEPMGAATSSLSVLRSYPFSSVLLSRYVSFLCFRWLWDFSLLLTFYPQFTHHPSIARVQVLLIPHGKLQACGKLTSSTTYPSLPPSLPAPGLRPPPISHTLPPPFPRLPSFPCRIPSLLCPSDISPLLLAPRICRSGQ